MVYKPVKGVLTAEEYAILERHGEMSEWLKDYAWKATSAKLAKRHGNTSSRNRFNDFPL